VTPEAADLWQRALQALRTAERLVEDDPDACASRSYYAAFYAVSALLAFDQSSFVKHTAVERAVHRDLVKPGIWPVEVGAAFSWLVTLRSTGDYGGEKHVQPEDAKAAVKKARLILRAAGDTAPEPLQGLGDPTLSERDQDEEAGLSSVEETKPAKSEGC
jgi:uncharacterized protein